MPIIRATIKPKVIIFLPSELELVHKYEIPYTVAINTTMGRINLIICLKIICIDI
jgi:hypothetical protein